MKKRILSLLLVLVMCITMLSTVSFAAGNMDVKVTADKATPSVGDTVRFTVSVCAVTDLTTMDFVIDVPDGLSYVANSAKLEDGLREKLNAAAADWTELTYKFTMYGDQGYSSAGETAIMTFDCLVTDAAAGELSVSVKNISAGDLDYTAISCNIIPAKISISKPATGITLDKSATTIYTGSTETLTATVTPEGSTDSVTWTSGNESVATVADGVVTAVAPGTAVITAKAGEKSATCTVTVENAPCTHSEKIDHPAQASTCKDKGWDAYDECKECHQLFDKAGNKIDAIPYRSLAGHDLRRFAGWGATCTTNGNKPYYKCTVCEKLFEDAAGNIEITDPNSVIITAYGHDYSEKIADEAHKKSTAANCQEHDTYWFDCSRCNQNAKDDSAATDKWYTSANAGPHSYATAWTDYDTGHAHKCQYCDAHDELVLHTPGPAATEDTAQTCTACGHIITPALGHTHSVQQTVEANPYTCTTDGNQRYYICRCGEWFWDADCHNKITNHADVVESAPGHDWKAATCTEPKTCRRPGCGATEGTANGHSLSGWKSDSEGHWKECANCDHKTEKMPHEPDREAPTVNDPVKCKDCGYEIMPVLPTVTVELPFTVTVKQGGNVAPGKQAFELELFNIGNSNESEYADVKITATVETDGKGDYTAKLVISGSEEQVNALISEGFYIREKNTKAEGWTYSDAVWHVVFEDSIPTVYPTTMETTDNGVNYEDGEAVESNTMTFVNTYTVNETPKPTPDTPKTGDSSMILWVALVLVSGTAVVGATAYSRKKRA